MKKISSYLQLFLFVFLSLSAQAQLPVDANGWTVFTPSNDSRIIYVSSSTGSDANNGLSAAAAKQTIAAGMSLLRDSMPDWLLLNKGDIWNEKIGWFGKSGRSASEPMLLGSYGASSCDRPLLKTDSMTAIETTGGGGRTIDNLVITGLHFYANSRDPLSNDYVPYTKGGAGISFIRGGSNILIEDCKIDFYINNIVIQAYDASFINVKLRRNLIVDAYDAPYNNAPRSGGIFMGANGPNVIDTVLFEGNLFDHNGWNEQIPAAYQSVFSHQMYIHDSSDSSGAPRVKNVTIIDNILARGDGLQLRAGGRVENNLFLKMMTTMFTGKAPSVIKNNVVLDGMDMSPTDPRGWGIIAYTSYGKSVVENNIVAHKDTSVGGAFAYAISELNAPYPTSGPRVLDFNNNISYDWNGDHVRIQMPNQWDSIYVHDNTLQNPAGYHSKMVVAEYTSSVPTSYIFSGNTYYTSHDTDEWFTLYGPSVFTNYSFSTWPGVSAETGAKNELKSFIDPNRTIKTYNSSVGGTATLADFLEGVRKQKKCDWHDEFTSTSVNCYIRNGFRTPITFTNSSDTTICSGSSVILKINNINRKKYSISWDGGMTYSNDTIHLVSPTSSASYPVIIYDSTEAWLSCSPLILHTYSVTVNICSGIKPIIENEEIKIYPNPCSGLFNVETPDNNTLSGIRIYNCVGELVLENSNKQNKYSIDLRVLNLSQGIYYIDILSNDKTFRRKISLLE